MPIPANKDLIQSDNPYSGTAASLDDFVKAVRQFNAAANDDISVKKLQNASETAIQKIEENE